MVIWEDLDLFDSEVEKAHIGLMVDACNSSDDSNGEEVNIYYLDLVRQAYYEVVYNRNV